MIDSYSNSLGFDAFDAGAFDESILTHFDYLSHGSPANVSKRCTYGWGAYGARVKSRPEIYTPINREISTVSPGTISLVSASGALQDTIRTDVRRPLLQNIQFTDGQGGNADFQFQLHKMPPFPLIPFSMIIVRVGNTAFDWYCGLLNYPSNGGQGPFKFTGKGLTQYLNTLEAETTFAAGPSVDLTDVVREIAQTWIAPYAPISYNENKILASAGVPLITDIKTSKIPIGKTLEILADACKCRFGVDGDRDFFFIPFEADPTAVYFVGKDFHDWDPEDNMDEVTNYWLLTRNGEPGSDQAGWRTGAVKEDASSQKKYAFRKKTKQFPGYWGTDTFDLVGDNLLEKYKDPQPAGRARAWAVPATGMRYIPIGRCYVVEPPAKNWTIMDDLDSVASWTGPAFADVTNLMWAAGSIRVDHPGFESESGSESEAPTVAYLTKTLEFYGKITKLAFYADATTNGLLGNFIFGDNSPDEYSLPLEIYQAGAFQRYEVDITALVENGLDRIRYFGVEVDAENACSVYLDRLEVEIFGSRWLNLFVTKVKYDAKMQVPDVEFGTPPPSFPSFLRGLMAQEQDLKFGQEVR